MYVVGEEGERAMGRGRHRRRRRRRRRRRSWRL